MDSTTTKRKGAFSFVSKSFLARGEEEAINRETARVFNAAGSVTNDLLLCGTFT